MTREEKNSKQECNFLEIDGILCVPSFSTLYVTFITNIVNHYVIYTKNQKIYVNFTHFVAKKC